MEKSLLGFMSAPLKMSFQGVQREVLKHKNQKNIIYLLIKKIHNKTNKVVKK